MRTTRRRTVAVAVTLVLVFAVAACGNSSSESKPTTTTAGNDGGTDGGADTTLPGEKVAVDAPGVTDDEIKVGGVASVDNPLGGKYGDSFEGVKAYFDMINASGGIYGRELELVAERDDKAFNNSTEVEALLTEDIFAVLPVATLLFTGAQKLVDEGIPTFGWIINPEWEGSAEDPKANLFGQTGSFLCFDCASPGLPWLVGAGQGPQGRPARLLRPPVGRVRRRGQELVRRVRRPGRRRDRVRRQEPAVRHRRTCRSRCRR